MYEMQGTLPGLAASGRPVTWPFPALRAARQSKDPREGQVSLLLRHLGRPSLGAVRAQRIHGIPAAGVGVLAGVSVLG